MADNPQDSLHFMLGEMSANIKKLVDASEKQSGRVSVLEKEVADLKAFRTKIGVVTMSLGAIVPTAITVAARKLGLM